MNLIDFSGIIFAALHVDIAGGQKPHKEYIRHLTINSLRHYNVKFRDQYGEMIICFDDKSWRREVYEFYKWERSNNRDKDQTNDWEEIFQHMEEIKADIAEHFPFPVIQTAGAEADDVIGVLCQEYNEPIMIISNDKDLVACTRKANVKQYRPFTKKEFEVDDVKYFEYELIVKGDKADGIPSIKCPDDFFAKQIAQREAGEKVMRAPGITKPFLAEFWEVYKTDDESAIKVALGTEMYKRFVRNRQLISLSYIPENIKTTILHDFTNAKRNPEMKTLNYMIKNRMNIMAKNISDFKPNRKLTRSLFDL